MSTERAVLAGGCFWGMQDLIRKRNGVTSTRVGYSGGDVPNATYRNHGTHAEGIEVVFEDTKTSYRDILEFFFQIHDPTTLNRQGNDRGPQYRSAIFWTTREQEAAATATSEAFQRVLTEHGHGAITTQMAPAQDVGEFYYAEAEHQQYLHKHPGGYCNHGPNGLTCPVGVVRQDELPAQQSVLDPGE